MIDEDWIETFEVRQQFLFKHTPTCPKCKDPQVQIMGYDTPAPWRCRMCKHSFKHEPVIWKGKK